MKLITMCTIKNVLATVLLLFTAKMHAEDSIVRSKNINNCYSLTYMNNKGSIQKVEIYNNDHTLSSAYKFSKENKETKIDSIFTYNHGILESQTKLVLSDQPVVNDSNYTNCYYKEGETVFYEFITYNLTYPEECAKNGIEGICLVNFIVSREGLIVGPFCNDQDVHPLLIEEALRIIKSFDGKWEPASRKGVPTHQYCKIPIQFTLE